MNVMWAQVRAEGESTIRFSVELKETLEKGGSFFVGGELSSAPGIAWGDTVGTISTREAILSLTNRQGDLCDHTNFDVDCPLSPGNVDIVYRPLPGRQVQTRSGGDFTMMFVSAPL